MTLWFTRTINKNMDLLRKCMKIRYICQMPSKMYKLAEIILSMLYTELVENESSGMDDIFKIPESF